MPDLSREPVREEGWCRCIYSAHCGPGKGRCRMTLKSEGSENPGVPAAPRATPQGPEGLPGEPSEEAIRASWKVRQNDYAGDSWGGNTRALRAAYALDTARGPVEGEEPWDGEVCRRCSGEIRVVWTAPTALWNRVAGDFFGSTEADRVAAAREGVGGCLCIECFTDLADDPLRWVPQPQDAPVQPEALHLTREEAFRHAFTEAVIPLEVIAGQHRTNPYKELSEGLIEQVDVAIEAIRAALPFLDREDTE